MEPLKMYFLFKMGIFQLSYVSLPEGNNIAMISFSLKIHDLRDESLSSQM